MSVTTEDIENVAALARVRIDPGDIAEVTDRIAGILDLVDQMQAVATEDVEPLANPLDAVQRLRPDEVTEPDLREQFQAIAPQAEAGLYLVPRVIE